MKNKKKYLVLLLASVIIMQQLSGIVAYAADAGNYTQKTIDYNLYVSDYHNVGYYNECTLVDITPSVSYVNGSGKKVATTTVGSTVYVPSGTYVKVAWKMNGSSAFSSKELNIWQKGKDPNFKTVTNYNIGNPDPIGLRGSASDMVGDMITSKTKDKWTQTYTVDEFNSINFLCASPQVDGAEGESAAVGASMGNVTEFYHFTDKPDIKEDNNPPSVAATLSNDPSNGWYAPGTKATFSASDADSGIASFIVAGQGRTSPFTMDLANGGNTITYSATDNAGKSSDEKTLTANVDATAPSVSATTSQDPISGWYKDDTSVTFNTSDSESGVKSFTVNGSGFNSGSSEKLEEGTKTYKVQASDNVGNSSGEQSFTYSVDKTEPTASIIGTQTIWTNQDIELRISGKDNHSGLTSMIVEYSSDNANWVTYATRNYDKTTDAQNESISASKNGFYRLIAYDAVGHKTTSSATIAITKIDKEKPTIVATVTGDEGAPVDKWYKKSAKIRIVATDTGVSGLKQLYYNEMSTTENSVLLPTTAENINIFTYSAEDNAGNSTGKLQTDVYVDASKPVDLSWTSNQNTWTNQDITVTMKAKDIYSGLKKFVIQKQNETTKEWEDYSEVKASYETILTTKTALIKENGTYRFKAIDRVGYEEIVDTNIVIGKIDKEKPVVTPTEIGTKSSNGWFKDSVNLKLFSQDFGVSGLKTVLVKVGITTAQTDVPDKQIMTNTRTEVIDDEGTTTAIFKATDWATNVSDTGTSVLKVDKTTPKKVNIAADTTTWTNKSVAVTAKATDSMSGLSKIIIQKDADSSDSYQWRDYIVKDYIGESTEQTNVFEIEENGTYRIKAIDMVGYEMTSDESMKDSSIEDPSKPDKPGIITIDKIDKTKPIIEATILGGEGYKDTSGGWYKDDARLKLTATDEASGVGTITCNDISSINTAKSKTYEEQYPPFQNGVNKFDYFATDVAGNNSETGISEIKIDMTNPVTASLKRLTTEWVNSTTGVKIECTGQDNESGLLQFVLERSENGTDGWTTGPAYTYIGETSLETVSMIVKQNGYYRLAVYDRVQNITYSSDVVHVDNIDDTLPEGASLGISPNTEEWVNESTGVDLTATGQDTASGISNLYVFGKTQNSEFEKISVEGFSGETSMLSSKFQTHFNGYYKTGAEDKVGNYKEMKDEEALEVPNIDPVNPSLVVEVDSLQWASLESGYEIYAYAKDSESGLNSIKLQMLNEAGEWQDTGIDFEKQSYTKNEEKLSTYEGNFVQNLLNKGILAFNKQFLSNYAEVANDKAVSGNNEMVKVLFKVTKNGTYRIVTDDIVANITNSKAVVVTTMDFDSPTLMVEGNPTEWTNQTATIKVTAKDASSAITKMTLNGKEVDFKNVNGAYFFTFDVEKNATYQVSAIDKAGHSTSQTVDVTKIDKENPFVNSELGEWVEGLSNAKVNVGDVLSGVKNAYINDVMIEVADGYQATFDTKIKAEVTYIVTITDNAGNKAIKQVSESKMLDHIKVTTPPDKTSYKVKENFMKKGMVVTAYYTDKSETVVTDFKILDGENLAVEQNKINVSYAERGITKTDDTDIKVGVEGKLIPTPITPIPEPTPEPGPTPEPEPEPSKPVTPTPTKPTPMDEVITDVVKEEPEVIKETKKKETVVVPQKETVVKETNRVPVIAVVGGTAGAGMFLIFLFFMLTNVKVYSMREDGNYKLIGRTRAKKKDEFYYVKTNPIMILNAASGDFKFVFSKGFINTHSDINVTIKIENKEFNRFLAEGENTVYVEFDI